MLPTERVYISKSGISDFIITDVSSYKSLICEDDKRALVPANCFNGTSLRLEDISEGGIVTLAPVKFFDLMTTNMLMNKNDCTPLEKKIKLLIEEKGVSSFTDIMRNPYLANAVAVSISIIDSEGRALVVERGYEVGIGAGKFSTTCTGSLIDEDIREKDPIMSCALRELKEELCLTCDLNIDELVIVKDKLQPVVLLSGTINEPFEDILQYIKNAPDFYKENLRLYAVPMHKLNAIVHRYDFTDAAAYQLTDEYYEEDKTFKDSIMDYLIYGEI